jgi:carotenoid 1,2-hydratase
MTERGRASLTRDATRLTIGPSALAWEADALTISFDETTAPLPSPLKGVVRLYPRFLLGETYGLDDDRRHLWRPIAPRARVEVELSHPAVAWRGEGYFDTNAGDEPLERAFHGWDWSRAHLGDDTLLFYDVNRRVGGESNLALRIGPDGETHAIEPPPRAALAKGFWGAPRATRGEPDHPPVLTRTLEDAPFYMRSALRGSFGGEPAEIVQESLSLDRLRNPVVRAMLPFRMPRWAR